MYKNKRIQVSIPAYNEEEFIGKTLTSIPDYIDVIVVTNDASSDRTKSIIMKYAKKDKRIDLVDVQKAQKKRGQGPGEAILKANERFRIHNSDIIVVIDAQCQMDLSYIPKLLDEIIEKDVDYAKGNRFFHMRDLRGMPFVRLVGNIFVTFLTKIGSGYWSIADPLNGYTAITTETFKKLNKDNISKNYAFEVSMLIELWFVQAKVKDVFIPAIYGSEKTKVKFFRDTFRVSKCLAKGFFRRMVFHYTLLNFHPLIIFLLSGCILLLISVVSGVWVYFQSIGPEIPTAGTVLIPVTTFLIGLQLIIQACVLDIQNEPK